MTRPLSPAAQAVLDAAYALPLRNGQPSIVAALHALADQVVPVDPCGNDCCITQAEQIRSEIIAIAAELKGRHD